MKTVIPTQDPPTFLKIRNTSPRKVYAGKKFTLQFETDARPDYFESPDSFIAVIDPPAFGQYTGTTRVNDGHGIVYLHASEDLKEGETGKITLELRPPRSTAISDSIESEVIQLEDKGGEDGSGAQTPNIDPVLVDIDHQYFIERGWDETSVAEVESTDEKVAVFVSAANKLFKRFLARAQRHGDDAIEVIKDFYLEHIAFHAVIADIDKKNSEKEGGDPDQIEKQYSKEMTHACETVCGIMESMFDILIVELKNEGTEAASF